MINSFAGRRDIDAAGEAVVSMLFSS